MVSRPVDHIASVASFFVSRVDSRVDPLLDRMGGQAALRGKAAIANAARAYAVFEQSLETPGWKRLSARGARPQRPLWASTSTKDPRYPDVYYVEALVAPDTVNTLPPETMAAYHAGMRVVAFTFVSTWSAGLGPPIVLGPVVDIAHRHHDDFRAIVRAAVPVLAAAERRPVPA